MDHKEAAAQAKVIHEALVAHRWTTECADEPTNWQKNCAHSSFLRLAHAMGYRVSPIGDGINTGKPVVAGGV